MNVAFWCSGTGQVWTWRYTPFLGVWAVAAGFVGSYLLAHRRAGRPLDARLTRRWMLGVLAIVVVSEWPLGALGAGYLATVGVVRWLVYTFVAAPLLVSGLPSWLLERWVPPGSHRETVVGGLTTWWVALLLFNVVMIGSHTPAVVDTLKVTQAGSFLIDAAWLVAALAWWFPALRPEPHRPKLGEPARSFYLFATSMLMFVPASFLTFAPLPLYGVYELAPPLWAGFDPIVDQQAAGIAMNVLGGVTLWVIIAALFLGWAHRQEAEDRATARERDRRLLADHHP